MLSATLIFYPIGFIMYSLYLFWFTHVTELEKNTKTETDMTPKREPDLLIHCSGGIGRSGTFLTVFHHYSYFKDMLENKKIPTTKCDTSQSDNKEHKAVSLKETVHFMRLQRHPWMVEGDHQYTLAYDITIQLMKNLCHGNEESKDTA